MRNIDKMTKLEFKRNVFSLSESIYPMVCRMLGTMDNTEDAIQEIMLKLWERRKDLAKHPNMKGFVFVTARNHCIDVLRKKALLLDDSTSHLRVLKAKKDYVDMEFEELNAIIDEILKTLPKQQKEVFILRDIDGYEFKEIADTLEIKIEHVRVLLSRARKKVGDALEKTYDYERGNY